MGFLRRLLIGGDERIEQRNMSWNMLGSFLYALASMVLTIAVIQIVGEDEGGIFSFAYSTFGQHMFMVAYFGIRPFHITDTRQRYSFGEYLCLRLATCGGALLFGLAYIFLNRDSYSFVKAATIFLMVAYKVIDGFADVYEAEFQRNGRLYLTGKSNTFRTLLSVTIFLGCLWATRNLVFSSAMAVAAQILGVLLFDISVIGALPQTNWKRRRGRCTLLFKENFVLFLSVILDFYVFSAAKYAIEGNMADRYQAVFAAIFMPTSVINLVAGFVIRPYITEMSRRWENGEFGHFAGIIGRLSAIIAALTVLALGGAWLLGIPVLSLLYPKIAYMLEACRLPLLFIILGGAFNAYINLFYYALIIMQEQKRIFIGYAAVTGLALLISSPFVRAAGLLGGAVSYMILMAALTGLFGLMAFWFYRKGKEGAR
ncbi:MAG: lipopolysaccharide biosynthesis protein [Pseudomonadota bacterium]|nr:lipopolysaccharide biosynthesis protein [Pseudomonadota bacterium]